MSIKCVPSNLSSDIRCAVCGQGFLVFVGRDAKKTFDGVRQTVLETLRQHHSAGGHPSKIFTVECQPLPQPVHA